MLHPHLVVTGRVEGKSVFVDERPLEPARTPAFPGLELFPAWGTADGEVSNAGTEPKAVLAPYFPGAGGTRLVLVTWPPAATDEPADPRPATPWAEEILAGLAATVEKDHPGMHTSATLDYGVVLSGEMWVELDDGAERRLPTGTCVVQRGTRHRWSNRGTEPATMAFVLIGAAEDAQ